MKPGKQQVGLITATSLVVTHDMKSAFSVATKMAMMNDGKIIAAGTPEEFQQSKDPVVRRFLD